jgi:hypothetical protein
MTSNTRSESRISTLVNGRTGPFWDSVAGREPLPPAAATLGFELVDADVVGRGRVVRRDGDIGFLEAELLGSDDNPVAIGMATARVIARDVRGS